MNLSPLLACGATGFFVTGTDTGVGKTHVSSLLVEHLVAQGLRVGVMKPVAAGEEDGLNDDVRKLMGASNVQADLHDVNPYSFVPPIAPHIAAGQAGRKIDLDVIARAYARLRHLSDLVIVEGAGGLLVPLGDGMDTSAIPEKLGLPVLLVVGVRLGCLNHALLTAEVIAARKLHFVGWFANIIDPSMLCLDENIKTLESCIQAPCLGVIAHQASAE